MEKIWLSSYIEGTPEFIDNAGYDSLRDLIEENCRKHADKPAYANMGVTLSFADIDRLSAQFAAYLQHELGLAKGERVALMMPNILQYPIALFGVLRAGLVAVNVNPLYTKRELEHQMNDSGAKAIVIVENFASTLSAVIDKTGLEHVITTQIGDMLPGLKRMITNVVVKRVKKMVPEFALPGAATFRQALAGGAGKTIERREITLDDLAFLQYTGGTTGVAKGAMLSHGNLVHNVQQSNAWLGNKLDDTPVIGICALPLYHIFSLEGNCFSLLEQGGLNVLIANPRDFDGFVDELAKYPFSYFTGVNTLFNALLGHPRFASLDFSHLRITIGGGMAVQRAVAEKWRQVTGTPLIQAYGLTETSPAAVINPFTEDLEYTGAIGLPISSTEVAIMDDDGNHLAVGEIGEICIRGPQVMQGYWQRPEETENVMEGDWLRTGDVGRMDEKGFIFIEDRKKDMILVSGFNVYPNEIEDVVVQMQGIIEAAAVGKPDEKSGEIVKLYVFADDPSLDAKAVIAYCRENLTGYKVPKEVVFRDEELPKTNVGKILRRELRDA
ncbi:MAG: AMP-binding protein [Pseudomonadota bacterium]